MSCHELALIFCDIFVKTDRQGPLYQVVNDRFRAVSCYKLVQYMTENRKPIAAEVVLEILKQGKERKLPNSRLGLIVERSLVKTR